jgi:hypothetical protein
VNPRVHVRADSIYTLCGRVIEKETLTLSNAPAGAILCWPCRTKSKALKSALKSENRAQA